MAKIGRSLKTGATILGAILLVACSEKSSNSAKDANPEPMSSENVVGFGAEDTLGAANYLSNDKALAAAQLVTQGKAYSLGVPVDKNFPVCCGRSFEMRIQNYANPIGQNKLHGNDEIINSHIGIGTQIDGFGHSAVDGKHYNGFSMLDVYRDDGLKHFGVDKLPPIVTRGLLLDMTILNKGEMLPGGFVIDSEGIKEATRRQNLTIGQGDVVLLHTGWMEMIKSDPETYIEEEPGLNEDGARYLADLGVIAIGADTAALDVKPEEIEGEYSPVHGVLLVERGVYILENVKTEELASDEVYEFLFVLGVPKIKGAPQGMINPIAIR